MFIDFAKILQPKWLLDPVPPANFFLFWPFFGFFVALILLAIFSYLYFSFIKKEPPYQKLKSSLLNLFLTCGILGLILLGFRNQSIPYFSSRILLIILLAVFFILLTIIIIFSLTKLRKNLREYRHRKELAKYLPGKKK